MATENFPIEYVKILNAQFRRSTSSGFIQSSPQSGTPYNKRRSFDNPVIIDLAFSLQGGKKALFDAWVKERIDGGIKPFNIPIDTEGGEAMQEAWFTDDGVPTFNLNSTQASIYNYTATIRLRKLVNPYDGEYDLLLGMAEISPCGDPFAGANLLDIAVNEDLPEA